MATGPRYKVPFRRRRDNQTDYYVRKRLLTSGAPRAIVRRSSKNISVQFAGFDMLGDVITAAATSKELKAFGWSGSCANIPAAYLTGYLAGKKALKAGIEYAVLDIGMQTPAKGAVLFASVAGMVEAGLEVPHGEGVLPSEERLNGSHINDSIKASVGSVKDAIGGGDAKKTPKAAKAPKAEKPKEKAPKKAEGEAKKAEPKAAVKEKAPKAEGEAKKAAPKKKAKEAE